MSNHRHHHIKVYAIIPQNKRKKIAESRISAQRYPWAARSANRPPAPGAGGKYKGIFAHSHQRIKHTISVKYLSALVKGLRQHFWGKIVLLMYDHALTGILVTQIKVLKEQSIFSHRK
jgi:hypothetical protein